MMADITLSYKGSTIATMSASGSKTIQTKEKYCEDDISLVYDRSGNAYKGNAAPSADLGSNGDVYFLMSDYAGGPWMPEGVSGSAVSGGWSFKIARPITIKGIRVYPNENTCSVYLSKAGISGNLKSVIDQPVTANAWNDIILDEPITLTDTNGTYTVWFSPSTGFCSYSDIPISCGLNPISFVSSLYSIARNQVPTESARLSPYGVDLIMVEAVAHDQYVKTSGTWSRV